MKDNMIDVLLERARHDNCRISQYALVDYYMSHDVSEALYWLYRSVEQGFSLALMYLGILYFEGKVVTQDYKMAYKCFIESVKDIDDYTNTISAEYLVRMYEHGLGVDKNLNKAFDIYSQMAESGNYIGRLGMEYFYLNDRYTIGDLN